MIICLKVYIIDTQGSAKSEFYMDKFAIDHEDNLESEVTCNMSLLLSFCLAGQHILVLPGLRLTKHYVLEDIANIIKFDIMCFNLLADQISTTID